MDTLTCGICLDQLRVPVSTPCGHLCCEACLTSYIETSADAMNASCPTCRAPFTIAIPDLRFVPKKYHTLIIPSIRRIFIADASDNGAQHQPPGSASVTNTNRELRAQIATLTDKVNALVHDKGLLMDRCEAAIRARDVHAQGERAIRLEKERIERELKDLRRKYDCFKGKYKTLKASQQNAPLGPALPPAATTIGKRKSHPAVFDALLDASLVSSSASTNRTSLLDLTTSSDTPASASRVQKRPRLLGSPFDLAKRVESRSARRHPNSNPNTNSNTNWNSSTRGRSGLLIDEGEEGDSGFRASDFDMELGFDFDFDPEIEGDFDLDVSSSGGPQRSGLPVGDVFSPRAPRGGRGSISFGSEGDEEEEHREKVGERSLSRSVNMRLGGVRPTWMLSPVDE